MTVPVGKTGLRFVRDRGDGTFRAACNRKLIKFCVDGFETVEAAHAYAVQRIEGKNPPRPPRKKRGRPVKKAVKTAVKKTAKKTVWQCRSCGFSKPKMFCKCPACNGYDTHKVFVGDGKPDVETIAARTAAEIEHNEAITRIKGDGSVTERKPVNREKTAAELTQKAAAMKQSAPNVEEPPAPGIEKTCQRCSHRPICTIRAKHTLPVCEALAALDPAIPEGAIEAAAGLVMGFFCVYFEDGTANRRE